MLKNKTCFQCAIDDNLISEYDVSINGVTTNISYRRIYWEAVVYFEKNDFILNAYTQTTKGIEEIEVLKFPFGKIKDAWISHLSSGLTFKTDAIAGGFIGIIALLGMLIHPEEGSPGIGIAIFTCLFFGIGFAMVLFVIQFFFIPSKKILRIKLQLYDGRVITLFADPAQKERIRKIIDEEFFKKIGIRMS